MQRLMQVLKDRGMLKNPEVEAALLKVDRRHYCPTTDPYLDSPHPIGFGATISAPHMHAFALEAIRNHLKEGSKVLDVGSGSGYLTACIAHLVGSTGKVYAVEHVRDLIRQSEINIRNDCPELLDSGRIKIIEADGRNGLPDYAPYDVIHVGATAPNMPDKLIEQLKEGGLMVLPVQRGEAQQFESVEKLKNGELKIKQLLAVRYVPLTDVKSQIATVP